MIGVKRTVVRREMAQVARPVFFAKIGGPQHLRDLPPAHPTRGGEPQVIPASGFGCKFCHFEVFFAGQTLVAIDA